MALSPSQRSLAVPPFEVMTVLHKVFELRAAGHEVISLCAGEPAAGAPSGVRRRAAEVVTDGTALGYSNALGLAELRQQLAGHYRRWYGIEVPIGNLAITTGSSGAFLTSFLAAFDHGDRVALARPGYPAYKNILASLGLEVVELDCGPAERFQPTVELLERAYAEAPLAGLVVASPANPTGTMLAPGQLAELASWCRERGVRLVSDEIYHGVTYGDSVGDCAWAHDRTSIVVSSFSKYWGMTGWRLGWALVPDDLIGPFEALTGNLSLCPPVPAQYACVEAFTKDAYAEGAEQVADYAAARQVVLDHLDELGWVDVAPADGAFYLYATIAPVLGPYADSGAWCEALLEQQRVALTPGPDFDSAHGHQAVRISLAAGAQAVAEAVRRILDFQRGLEVSARTTG
ncbi:aspartate aminotransferase [Enemella dayhoffiae]|uniref:Aminotransferase n=1 Tax=Enemella dayhoffiae TaxID=2016507 RepID=A0A255HB79_9ACTN|nr:aminotransferase class I/II-fold pyridoxal phosphate-dependent enzyme [Enemella dayhoffiae]OYO25170.1 aspartate aminotransferase [Enemella dayhoffiae]